MSRPFRRPSEEARQDFNRETKPSPGVRVLLADGRRFFFGGGTVQLAMSLARMALPDDIDGDATRIEYGSRLADTFAIESVVKPGVRYGTDG